MHLFRAHGLGNDYLVLEEGPPLTPERAVALCDRHRGVGSDGVLEPFATTDADYGVRIWNPDGSLAEKSGNGLRIFARWLADRGAPRTFSVWTGACRVTCEVDDATIAVEMGRASVEPADVPVSADRPVVDEPWDVGDLRVCAVGVGNPHCVVWRDEADLDALPWAEWGRRLERHPRFPRRTNVQFARRVGESEGEIRIFERGAGPTMASGSSACAVAASGVHTGRWSPGRISLRMPGGTLWVDVDAALNLRLVGPVAPVGRFAVDPRWLASEQAFSPKA